MMEEEDEDSMYAPAESTESGQALHAINGTTSALVKSEGMNDEEDGEEEGEEVEEDESDSVGADYPNSFTISEGLALGH